MKSNTKDPLKFLSSSGIRVAEIISVYQISIEKCPSFGNQRILNFRVLAVHDINLRTHLSKKKVNIIYIIS